MDDLLYRYLPAEGMRSFRLDAEDIRQYGFLALDKVIQKYGLLTHDPQTLWDCVQRRQADVLLLPDRPGSTPPEPMSFVLRGVNHVPQTVRRVLVNMVLDAEVRPSESRRSITQQFAAETKPRLRFGGARFADRESVLEWLSSETASRNTEQRLQEFRSLANEAVSSMNPRHGKVIELLLSGHRVAAIASMMSIPEQTIYTILRTFSARARTHARRRRESGGELAKGKEGPVDKRKGRR